MQQQSVLYGIVGLLLGSLLTVFITQAAVNTENQGMMRMMGLAGMNERRMERFEQNPGQVSMGTSMNGMMGAIDGKMGTSFDKAFLEAMIVHHEGAIRMAEEAKVRGQHSEVKKMAEDIISVQTKEIEQMRGWISEWGL